jgi:hypothetical protein
MVRYRSTAKTTRENFMREVGNECKKKALRAERDERASPLHLSLTLGFAKRMTGRQGDSLPQVYTGISSGGAESLHNASTFHRANPN